MTVSSGKRHNYLAIWLCRYRSGDHFVTSSTENTKAQRPSSGMNTPSIEPKAEEKICRDIPGYDLRRLIQAQDPLCAVNAFFVQVVIILATCLGVRMCPDCPHCEGSSNPCQDSFGSVAEPMGGFAGRTDAVFGAKECQKTNGSLHLHFFAFIQRLHQYCNMVEIAERLEKALVNATDLKNFINHICCTTYPDVDKFEQERAELENIFPHTQNRKNTKTQDNPGAVENVGLARYQLSCAETPRRHRA